jgi:hypothetical protein
MNNKLTPFISMQNQHNAMYREEEREMMPMLKHFGVGVIPWGPLGAGCEWLNKAKTDSLVLCRPFDEMSSTVRGDKGRNRDGRGEQCVIPNEGCYADLHFLLTLLLLYSFPFT